ncbi:MAG: hypothetical protein U1E26_04575 [Coriobacteriia bacterium]|nr:hypothetical protein [Coriobacteriia bacterium]
MAGSLPKARRVSGSNRTVLVVLAVAALVLAGALAWLLLNGSFFSDEPQSGLERDYALLIQGLQSNPKDPATLMSLAEVEFDLGKKADAFAHANDAVKYAGEQSFYNLRYATLLVRNNQLEEAEKAIMVEIKITKTTKAEPHFLYAQILAEREAYPDAIKAMQTGLRIDPTAADMGIVYAQILEKAGKKDAAIDNYEKALRFLPGNEEAIAGLKRLGVKYSEPTGTVDPHSAPEGQ